MGYWDATEKVLEDLGGRNPTCPIHGCEMFPADDHGRFTCVECGFGKVHDLAGRED
jgi:ribosomal protein S27AE